MDVDIDLSTLLYLPMLNQNDADVDISGISSNYLPFLFVFDGKGSYAVLQIAAHRTAL